jgi:hypothetical protein
MAGSIFPLNCPKCGSDHCRVWLLYDEDQKRRLWYACSMELRGERILNALNDLRIEFEQAKREHDG